MALGAQINDVFRLVLGKGLRLTLAGLAIGFLVSLALTRFLRTLLFGVTTTDALTFFGVALLLSIVALAGLLHSGAACHARGSDGRAKI